jgi:hypothetical protein
MTIQQFTATLAQPDVPGDLPPLLRALWHDAKGDWQSAHGIAQSEEGTKTYDRLHAYLHRKEGDASNARYWYRRAGAEVHAGTLEQEWQELVEQQLR